MTRSYQAAATILLALGTTAGSLTGCQSDYAVDVSNTSAKSASAAPPATTTAASSGCGTSVATTQQNLRILFTVDNSGSTAQTDPGLVYRVQTTQDFITNYGSKSNLTYSFTAFGNVPLTFDVSTSKFVSSPATPFGDATALTSALNLYKSSSKSIGTGDSTYYEAALSKLQSMITADETSTSAWDYVVVFLSDGQPTDIGTSNQASTLTSLINSLSSAVTAKGHLLTFSTVYFGPANVTEAIDNLQAMATAGGGQFVDTNTLGGANLTISDLINVPGQTCTGSNAI